MDGQPPGPTSTILITKRSALQFFNLAKSVLLTRMFCRYEQLYKKLLHFTKKASGTA